ncbi:MAG: HupE/UreJ family protein [Shimia sp.]|uniref:HupE/UreJ family protein n=1 Tax=Shimia sp. TaxID=1954381 RepID=UPI003B8B363A
MLKFALSIGAANWQSGKTRLWCLIALAFLTLNATAALAHDIGVSKVELREMDSNTYSLRVQVDAVTGRSFAAPELPEGFTFIANPRGIQMGAWKVYEFGGDQSLIAGDTLYVDWPRDGILITAIWSEGNKATRLIKRSSGVITIELSDLHAGSGSVWAASKRYLSLGVEHILTGLDHLLFVLCLVFVVNGGWRLIKTITAFTVAHSITLGLATFGWIALRPPPVEAAIALSIVFLASEILLKDRGRTSLTFERPWLVAFMFGLLHGLGFAGALSEIGLAPEEVPIALLFFNAGVELGQVLFVAFVLATTTVFKRLFGDVGPIRRARAAVVFGIGILAMYWFLDRFAGIVA